MNDALERHQLAKTRDEEEMDDRLGVVPESAYLHCTICGAPIWWTRGSVCTKCFKTRRTHEGTAISR